MGPENWLCEGEIKDAIQDSALGNLMDMVLAYIVQEEQVLRGG
jgi:hypothetical protein